MQQIAAVRSLKQASRVIKQMDLDSSVRSARGKKKHLAGRSKSG